jgi:predicted metal-dependent hydrolase
MLTESADLLRTAVSRHPQATREIQLQDHTVGYLLRRARRRSIGFSVSVDGLVVSAPGWVTVRDIEAALREKGAWIVRKLGEQQARQQQAAAAQLVWADGALLPYLAQPTRLVLGAPGRGVSWVPADDAGGAVDTNGVAAPAELRVSVPVDTSPEALRALVQRWLQRQARALFVARCAHFAPLLGVAPTRISLSAARTRWGSASASGALRFNWRLIHLAPELVDYVVVHELSHLREMNHSPAFWAVVASQVPNHLALRRQLRGVLLPAMD